MSAQSACWGARGVCAGGERVGALARARFVTTHIADPEELAAAGDGEARVAERHDEVRERRDGDDGRRQVVEERRRLVLGRVRDEEEDERADRHAREADPERAVGRGAQGSGADRHACCQWSIKVFGTLLRMHHRKC